MIVEILGAKMLAPYVGTSHFVWTAQIAVTLVALAVGYYAGGRLVDRSMKLGRLYRCVLVAAIYLCGSVLTVSVNGVGGNVGRLTALSTLGSFVGTVLIGYVLIPFLPNSYTMYFTALLLMLIVGFYFFTWEFKSHNKSAVATAIVAGLLMGYAGIRRDTHDS